MARFFSTAKLVTEYVANRVSAAAVRRGYAAVSPPRTAVSGGGGKKPGEVSKNETAWVPDPVTGYYRPENVTMETDVAEMRLREIFMKQKIVRRK